MHVFSPESAIRNVFRSVLPLLFEKAILAYYNSGMEIAETSSEDLLSVLALYEQARLFMHSHGNPTQWRDSGPSRESLEKDRSAHASFVVKDAGLVVGTFALYPFDGNYSLIQGAWLNEEPYVVIHRLASGKPGVGSFILRSVCAQYQNVRIDTHKDNIPMKNLLKKMGFRYCGIIPLMNADGSLRDAYMWNKTLPRG